MNRLGLEPGPRIDIMGTGLSYPPKQGGEAND